MISGVLADAGYHTAPDLLEPTEANPKGFFESRSVLRVNEDLLGQHVPISLRRVGRWLTPRRLRRGQLWLARVPPGLRFQVTEKLRSCMAACVPPAPFVLKDPRFCYTLPAWLPVLGIPACVVVFRHPAETVASILRETQRAPYLSNLRVDARWAAEVWERSYRSVLELEANLDLRFRYVRYDQVLHGDGIDTMSDFLGAPLRSSFVDTSLHRSRPDAELGGIQTAAESLYRTLCERSGSTV
jgi:hypothetical protein